MVTNQDRGSWNFNVSIYFLHARRMNLAQTLNVRIWRLNFEIGMMRCVLLEGGPQSSIRIGYLSSVHRLDHGFSDRVDRGSPLKSNRLGLLGGLGYR